MKNKSQGATYFVIPKSDLLTKPWLWFFWADKKRLQNPQKSMNSGHNRKKTGHKGWVEPSLFLIWSIMLRYYVLMPSSKPEGIVLGFFIFCVSSLKNMLLKVTQTIKSLPSTLKSFPVTSAVWNPIKVSQHFLIPHINLHTHHLMKPNNPESLRYRGVKNRLCPCSVISENLDTRCPYSRCWITELAFQDVTLCPAKLAFGKRTKHR